MSQRNNIIKLPGLIDVHVHLREPGATQKEDFYTGTQAAIAGGYTQVIDMPNNNPPTVTPKALEEKEKMAKGNIWCDLGFNFGASVNSIKFFKKIKTKTFGLKIYLNKTTGPLLIERKKDKDLIFKSWPENIPIFIHAEGKTLEEAINLGKKHNKTLHVCHTTSDQINIIEKAKKEGINITSEVSPHHLFLNKDDLKRLKAFGIMKPPLLSKKGQNKLWENIDKIDILATDHAPHTIEEKQEKVPPFGVPGLETVLPLMFTAIAQGKITTERLIEMTSTKPREIFNIPTQVDTFLLVDFSKTYKITSENLFTKSKWTPFEEMPGRGEIKKVVVRGKTVFEEGKFIGKPQGKIIYPEKNIS